MKTSTNFFSVMLSAVISKTGCLVIPCLLLFGYSYGQDLTVQKSKTKKTAMKDPEYKKTDSYAKRKAKHIGNFEESAHLDKKCNDGSILHIKYKTVTAAQKPNIETKDKKNKDPKDKKSDLECACSTQTLTANSNSFLIANNAVNGFIYPGAIYSFSDFQNSSFIKFGNPARNPITIVDNSMNLSGQSYVLIKDPKLSTMTDAIKKLARESTGAGNEGNTYQIYESGNSASQSLQVSGGGGGFGADFSASYNGSSASNSINLTIDATRKLYTINVEDDGNDFFKDANLENRADLMMVSSVTYGVRVLANLTYTFNTQADAETFKASYSGFGFNAHVSLGAASKSSSFSKSVNLYAVGGPTNVPMAFDIKELEKNVNKILDGVTPENAMPIEYTTTTLAGDPIATQSSVDDVQTSICIPNSKLKEAWVTFHTGIDDKHNDNHYNFTLYAGDAPNVNNYNFTDNGVKDPAYCFGLYKTGPLNVYFPVNSDHTDPVTVLGNTVMPTSGYFEKHGGLVHLHVYPNGSDTWVLNGMDLKLVFEKGEPQTVHFSKFQLSENSTEITLYFDGTFKQRQ